MSDLRPWLEEGASPLVRELLESSVLDEPAPSQLEALQARLAPLLGPGGPDGAPDGGGGGQPSASAPSSPSGIASGSSGAASAGAGAGAGAASVGAAGVAKVVAVAVVPALIMSAVAFQGGRVYERAELASVANAQRAVATARPAASEATAPPEVVPRSMELARNDSSRAPPAVVAPRREPTNVKVMAAPVGSPASPSGSASGSADGEVTLLQQAMARVNAGDARLALELIDEHARRFPDGRLAQEREVLAIQSLLASGDRAGAEARAELFRIKWRTSPHHVRIDAMLGRR